MNWEEGGPIQINPENVFWVTEYADGQEVIEPDEGWTIRNARPGALYLHIGERMEEGRRRLLCVINLAAPDGFVIPLFYRQKGIELDGPRAGRSQTLACVFGRGRVSENGVDAQLWTIDALNPIVTDAQPTHVDKSAVELIAEAFA
jgi:hypothetical protein